MKRTITITFTIDPADYEEAVDSPEGAVALAFDMLRGEADEPDECEITCDGFTRKDNVW